jgi:DNA-binding winged helix-turn-helix (wHTH) protein/Tol biopolymer transport system component
MTTPTAADERYLFGAFRLDVPARELRRDTEIVPLTAKAFDTLVVLVRHRDRVVDKETLMKQVWPDAFVGDDSLTQNISVLRRALGDDTAQPQFIVTVPRCGYRFAAPVITPVADEGLTTAAIATAAGETIAKSPGRAVEPRVSRWYWWTIATASAAAGLAISIVIPRVASTTAGATAGAAVAAPIRFIQDAPPSHEIASGAVISPDGKYLAFVARDDKSGTPQLWLRSLASTELRALPGTEHAFRPFWSPDSRAIAFFASGKLRRVGIADPVPQTITDVGYLPSGGAWSTADVIVYADRQSPLFAVPASGGRATPVTSLDRSHGEVAHQTPSFLPDGRHFLFSVLTAESRKGATFVGSLDSQDRGQLLEAGAGAVYAAPGYLLFVRDGAIVARRFDPVALRFTGAGAIVTTTSANAVTEAGVGTISASHTGLLTYGGDMPEAHLVWFDRAGHSVGTIAAPTSLHNPTISPDERYLAADGSLEHRGVWLVDLVRGVPTRFSDGNLPVWGPDGRRIVFTRRGETDAALLARPVTGPADAESALLRNIEMKIGGAWTAKGDVVYTASNPTTRLDLWVVSDSGDGRATPYLRTPVNEMQGQVSPDGRYLAYASDESGEWQVYVQTFPVPGGKRTISIGGGAEPQWRRDGKELYYLSPSGTLMAVDVRLTPTFDAGAPKPLFRASIPADIITYRNHFAVTGDGKRFVVDSAGTREPITVVVNWNALLNP